MRTTAVLAVLAAALVHAAPTSGAQLPPINASVYTALQATVVRAFNLTGGYGVLCTGTGAAFSGTCDLGDSIAGLVRLAFHDAGGAGGPYGNGGPNGCLDFSTSDNNNLANVLTVVRAARLASPFGSLVSLADYIVLSATTALQYATTLSPNATAATCAALALDCTISPLVLPFATGRVDEAACAGDAAYLPSASWTWPQIVALFGTNMSMSTPEIIGIMGAHSLGRVLQSGAVSGVTGPWIAAQASLSNLYHQMVFNAQAPWIQKGANGAAGTSTADAWLTVETTVVGNKTTTTGIVVLRTDAELGVNTTNSTGDTVCVSFGKAMAKAGPVAGNSCPARVANQAVFADFIAAPARFYGNFTTAWAKLTGFRYAPGDLTPVGAAVAASPSSSAAATPTASAVANATGATTPTAVATASGSAVTTSSRTPAVTATPTVAATPTVTAAASPAATPSSSAGATPSGTPAATPSPTATATPSPTAASTPTATAAATPSGSAAGTTSTSAAATVTPSGSGAVTPSGSSAVTPTGSGAPTPSATAASSTSGTAAATPTGTGTPTPSATAVESPSSSAAPTPTGTATATPSNSAALTATPSAAATPTGSAAASESVTAAPTGSASAVSTATATVSGTAAPSSSASGSATTSNAATTSPSTSATATAPPSGVTSPSTAATPPGTPTGTPSASRRASTTSSPTRRGSKSPSASRTGTRSTSGTKTGTRSPSGTKSGTKTASATRSGTKSQTSSRKPK